MSYIHLISYDKYIIKIKKENAFISSILREAYTDDILITEKFVCNNIYCNKITLEYIFNILLISPTGEIPLKNEIENIIFLLKPKELKNIINVSDYLDMNEIFHLSSKRMMNYIENCISFKDFNLTFNIIEKYTDKEKKLLEILFEHNRRTIHLPEINF
jgi:hypothetical protein